MQPYPRGLLQFVNLERAFNIITYVYFLARV